MIQSIELIVGCGKRTLGHGDSDTCGEPWMGGPDIYLCEACKVRQQWAASIGQAPERLVPDTRNEPLRDGSIYVGECGAGESRYALILEPAMPGATPATPVKVEHVEPPLPPDAPMVVLPSVWDFPDYEGGFDNGQYTDALRAALRKVGVGIANDDE